jgi:hypothetical protein
MSGAASLLRKITKAAAPKAYADHERRQVASAAAAGAFGLRSATIAQAIQRITSASRLLASQRECSIPSDSGEAARMRLLRPTAAAIREE